MAVALRAAGGNGAAASGALSLILPSGRVAGDFLLACVQASSSAATWTPAAGWTQIGTTVSGFAAYWIVRGGSDPATSFTPSTGSSISVTADYTGVDANTPFDFGSVLAKSATTAYATAAFYNNITGSMFVCFAGSTTLAATWTEQASITEDKDSGGIASRPSILTGHEAVTLTAGAQAARTITASSSGTGASLAIALRAASNGSIACDDSLGADTQAVGTAGTSVSFTHVVGTGASRLLVVTLETTVSQAGDPTTATYGGITMTQLDTVHPGSSGNLYLYYLLNPASGSATVAFTLQTSSKFVASATSFANVSQKLPFRPGQSSGNTAGTTSRFSNTSSSAPTVTIVTATSDFTYDVVAQFATANTAAMTAQTGRMQSFNGLATGGGTSTNSVGAGSITISPAGSQTLAWTISGAGNTAQIGCAITAFVPQPSMNETQTGLTLNQAPMRAATW